jgi:hypothetical protein
MVHEFSVTGRATVNFLLMPDYKNVALAITVEKNYVYCKIFFILADTTLNCSWPTYCGTIFICEFCENIEVQL